MSNLAIPPKTKKARHDDDDESEIENNEDMRLSDLPDSLLLHILSFLNAKNAIRTSTLSSRWKNLWKHIPTLILRSSDFDTLKIFDKFVSKILPLRHSSTALNALDFDRNGSTEPPLIRKLAKYVFSHSAQLQQLGITVSGDSCLILPCISSCRALTSLKLSIYPKGRYTSGITLFPKSLSLPALTSLDLTNFAFCTSHNADRAEPFSTFTSLKSLVLRSCTVRGAQILSISSATLVNLSIRSCSSDVTKIQLSAPTLSTFTFNGMPYQKLCGNSLSSVKHLDIDADTYSPYSDHPFILFSWLLDLDNIKSLTVTASALQVLSLVPDLLKIKLTSMYNLKSLTVKLKPLAFGASYIMRDAKLKNKSRKEAAKVRKALKAGLEPSETIPDGIVAFLCQNSAAKVSTIDYCSSSRKRMQNDTSSNEDSVEKSPPNNHSPPLDNGP